MLGLILSYSIQVLSCLRWTQYCLHSAVNNIFPETGPESIACKKLELKDRNEDIDDSMAESVTSREMTEVVSSAGKPQNPKLVIQDKTARLDQYFDEDSPPFYDEFGTDESPKAGFCSPGKKVEEKLTEETNADEKIIQSPKKVQLDESCIVINKNDWFISEASVDTNSPKIKLLPLASTLKLRLTQHRQQMKAKSKLQIQHQQRTAAFPPHEFIQQ